MPGAALHDVFLGGGRTILDGVWDEYVLVEVAVDETLKERGKESGKGAFSKSGSILALKLSFGNGSICVGVLAVVPV